MSYTRYATVPRMLILNLKEKLVEKEVEPDVWVLWKYAFIMFLKKSENELIKSEFINYISLVCRELNTIRWGEVRELTEKDILLRISRNLKL